MPPEPSSVTIKAEQRGRLLRFRCAWCPAEVESSLSSEGGKCPAGHPYRIELQQSGAYVISRRDSAPEQEEPAVPTRKKDDTGKWLTRSAIGALITIVGFLLAGWMAARIQAEDRTDARFGKIEERVGRIESHYSNIEGKLDILIEQGKRHR